VGGSRNDREARLRYAVKIAHDPAAEQVKHLHRVFEPDDVVVRDDQHGRRRDRGDLRGRPVLRLGVEVEDLRDERGPAPGVGRDRLVGLMIGAVLELVDVASAAASGDLRMQAIATVGHGRGHQTTDPGRVADRDLERDARADAVAEQIRLWQAEVVEQRDDVLGQQLEPQGPVDVGGVPVRLQFNGDDLPAGGQPRRVVLHQADGHQRAVDQHQRAAGAPRLVIKLQAAGRGEPRRHVTGAHQPVTRLRALTAMSPTGDLLSVARGRFVRSRSIVGLGTLSGG